MKLNITLLAGVRASFHATLNPLLYSIVTISLCSLALYIFHIPLLVKPFEKLITKEVTSLSSITYWNCASARKAMANRPLSQNLARESSAKRHRPICRWPVLASDLARGEKRL